MTAAPLHLAGETFLLDPAGVLVWPRLRLLAVADLHLEKASAAAARGALLPPWDSRLTLENLARLVGRYRPEIVVAVGDSVHDRTGLARMDVHDRARLDRIGEGRRMVWVAGNHDPAWQEGMGGEAAPGEWALGPVRFRHEARGPAAAGTLEVCGHHHPRARVPTRAGPVARPCFVACATGRRLMLPAFGAFNGGLDVGAPAIRALFPRGGRLFLAGGERLFAFDLATCA
jgi:uncharacterized protein